MKKGILFLSLLLITTGAVLAQKALAGKPAASNRHKAGGSVFSCAIDGKTYTATGSRVHAHAIHFIGKTPPYLAIYISNGIRTSNDYTLHFCLAPGARLAPGTYTTSERLSGDACFPSVFFDLLERKNDDAHAFTSMSDGSGSVTVTSVAGGWIKGTFRFNLKGDAENHAITNGVFRFKMPPIEQEVEP